jgi:flavin reductase (DIM6/NTAB) family NADH-FMN oxidoreductase RutF
MRAYTKAPGTPLEMLYPNPVVLVSCAHEGKDNIVTLAWAGTICSDPPLIGVSIRPSRHSHKLILASREFAVNQPTEEMLAAVKFCGTHSGRDEDKWEATGLTRSPATHIKAPLISECPVSIECVVQDVYKAGSHDLFIGKVVGMEHDEKWVESFNPSSLVFLGGNYGKAMLR